MPLLALGNWGLWPVSRALEVPLSDLSLFIALCKHEKFVTQRNDAHLEPALLCPQPLLLDLALGPRDPAIPYTVIVCLFPGPKQASFPPGCVCHAAGVHTVRPKR